MKPLKLVINAFGPYINKTEIDFTKFGDNGLYLITGDTGSGKTTIFDALSFALFGAASGNTRTAQALRSDFAKDGDETYVELEFLCHDEKYYIKRYCGYKTRTKTGSTKNIPEKVEFKKPNNTTSTVVKEVNQNIIDIIGIDKNQFAQIVMIAQGEFQKFLFAPTKDRREIFRKIFKTNLYLDFEQKLNDLCKDEYRKKSDLQLLLEKDISNIIPNSDTLEELKTQKNIYNLEELMGILDKSVKTDEETIKNHSEELEKLRHKIALLNQKYEKGQRIEQAKKELEELSKNLPELKKEAQQAETNYKAEKNKEKERNDLTVLIEKLKTNLKEYSELDVKQDELTKKKDEIKKSKNFLKDLKTQLETLSKNNEKDKIEYNNLKNISGDIAKNNADIENNKVKNNELKDIEKSLKEYRSEQDIYEKQKTILEQTQDDFEKKKKYADEIYIKIMANQAGFLAQNLKDGAECPVCGSTHHPKPAKLSISDAKEDDLKKANEDRDNAQQKSLEESKKLTAINTNITNYEKQLLNYAKEEFKLKVIEGLEEKLEIAISNNKKEAEVFLKTKIDLEKKSKEKETLEERINNFENNQKLINEKINIETNKQTALTGDISSLDATIKEKQKNLEFATKEETEKVLNEKEKNLFDLKQALDNAEKLKNEKETKLNNEKTRKKELEKSIPKDETIDVEKLSEELKLEDAKFNEIQASGQAIISRCYNNKRIFDNLKKSQKEYDKVSQKYSILDNLSRTAGGTLTGGKQKISFENYILATYFNEIIYAANKRFKDMTSYQFELRRAETLSGNAQSGLDLNVFDSYTGKTRNVSTLSGGESFKAALSLSLGLSDIVQQQAGGIQIDNMFIDEGFGSLDNESLEQTMKILDELSGNNTLIGIISHVSELREKIDKKIIVKKTQAGSQLSINIV